MLHGFGGTSMRLLTSKAGVNLAAVNYHFGSKDALIEAVFRRRLDPMNAARIAALERARGEAARRRRRRHHPRLRRREPAHDRGRQGRRPQLHPPARPHLHRAGEGDPPPDRPDVRADHGSATRRRSSAPLPQMPREELVWRMHFMFGTLAYTLAATDTVQLIAGSQARGSLRRAPARRPPDRVPRRRA